MGGKPRKKPVVPKSERLTGRELELAATYFAISNMGQEPRSMSVRGIQATYHDIACCLEYEYHEPDGPSAAGLDRERDRWREDFEDGGTYVHEEWAKLKAEGIEGLDAHLNNDRSRHHKGLAAKRKRRAR